MFNADKFDFWIIHERIKRFYPVGLSKNFNLHFDSPDCQELIKLAVENIHDEQNYNSRWTIFIEDLEKATGKKGRSTTYGQDTCFSASLILEETKMADLVRTKEISFYVSLIGPFFSIIGIDRSEINFEKNKSFWITNSLTTSPEKDYADIFKLIEQKIEQRFEKYRLVPFRLLTEEIPGLYTKLYDTKTMTVFNALFNGQVDLSSNITGDIYYGSDHWIRKDWDASHEGGWTIYPDIE